MGLATMKLSVDIGPSGLIFGVVGVISFFVISMVYRLADNWQYTAIAGASCAVVALLVRIIIQKRNPSLF